MAMFATSAPPLLFEPTFKVFCTNESSNIPIFAATKKSCVPNDVHLVEFDWCGAPLVEFVETDV